MNKLAYSTPTRNDQDTHFLLSEFRNIGYDGLQLKKGQYSPYLDEPNRFLDQWGQYPGIASALVCGGTLDDDCLERMQKIFIFAEAVGTELLVFCHGVERQGLTADDIRAFARSLSTLGKQAQDHNLKLSLHNHYDNPVMYRKDFDVFFDAVEDGSVGLTLDTAHLVQSGVDDVAGLIRDFRHAIDNFHLKDLKNDQFEVLGKGSIDFNLIFAAIHEIGYAGWISTDEESGAQLEGAMRHCLAFMKTGLK